MRCGAHVARRLLTFAPWEINIDLPPTDRRCTERLVVPSLAARVTGYLAQELRMDPSAIAPETPLVTSGLLDSVALVRLATFLEKELGVRIPDRDVRPEHFETVARIVDYVQRLRPER
jgi:acyl carrier protein